MKADLIIVACLSTLLLASVASAAETETAAIFEQKIRPLLAANCFDCHSAQADEVKSGLKLDSLEDVLQGGANGPAIVAGDAENSFLLRAIRYQEDDYQMPPRGRMSDEEIALFEAWVKSLLPTPNSRR